MSEGLGEMSGADLLRDHSKVNSFASKRSTVSFPNMMTVWEIDTREMMSNRTILGQGRLLLVYVVVDQLESVCHSLSTSRWPLVPHFSAGPRCSESMMVYAPLFYARSCSYASGTIRTVARAHRYHLVGAVFAWLRWRICTQGASGGRTATRAIGVEPS